MPIHDRIMTGVGQIEIIYTRYGGWIKPAKALIVPRSLIFQDDPLFSPDELQVGMHQTFQYVDSELQHDRDILAALGCRNLDCDMVCSVISSSFRFSEKSYKWISHLFEYLYTNVSNNKRHSGRCKSARFLRTATGAWTSVSESKNVYLPLSTEPEQMPMGIELSVLDSEFYLELSKSRTANLFLTLNLNLCHLSDKDLIKEIIRVHREGHTSQGDFDFETSLNHTRYLTRCQHLIGHSEKEDIRSLFRVADHHNLLKSNKEVIMDWTFAGNSHIGQCTLSEICSSDSRFSFLSTKYSSIQSDFLQSFTDVQNIASFAQETITQLRKRIHRTEVASPFYTELLSPKRLGNNLLLYYLADKGINSRSFSGKDVLFAALRQLEFLSENGSFSALSSCYLRTTSLEKFLTDEMDIVRIESPNDYKWSFLKSLGVTSEPNLELFLHQLREQKKTVSLTDHEGIEDRLYHELVFFCLGKSKDLRVLE